MSSYAKRRRGQAGERIPAGEAQIAASAREAGGPIRPLALTLDRTRSTGILVTLTFERGAMPLRPEEYSRAGTEIAASAFSAFSLPPALITQSLKARATDYIVHITIEAELGPEARTRLLVDLGGWTNGAGRPLPALTSETLARHATPYRCAVRLETKPLLCISVHNLPNLHSQEEAALVAAAVGTATSCGHVVAVVPLLPGGPAPQLFTPPRPRCEHGGARGSSPPPGTC